MNNWKETTLGELVKSGFVKNHNNKCVPLSSEVRRNMSGQYPYYGAASAIDHVNDYKFDGFYLLIAEDGTVFNGKGPMLQLVNGKFWVSNHSHVLQGKDEVATKILYYVLKNISISPYITGAVQPKLTKENLYNITFFFPDSKFEQKGVVKMLSSLDDKIELLRKQNETLEKIAQGIFRECFVNFKVDGKKLKLKNGIPEGWRIGKIYETGKVVCGKTPSKENSDYFDGKIPFIKIPDMHGQMFLLKTTDKLSKNGADSQKTKTIPKNSICVSCIATVGLVSITTEDSQTNQQINSVVPNDEYLVEYLYFSLKSISGFLNSIGSSGTTTANVNTGTFMNLEILIPTKKYLLLFHKNTGLIFSKIKDNNFQIQTLSRLRDTLLPKLMSGKIKIKT